MRKEISFEDLFAWVKEFTLEELGGWEFFQLFEAKNSNISMQNLSRKKLQQTSAGLASTLPLNDYDFIRPLAFSFSEHFNFKTNYFLILYSRMSLSWAKFPRPLNGLSPVHDTTAGTREPIYSVNIHSKTNSDKLRQKIQTKTD